MRLAYFLGTSLIDYPGKLSAVLWTIGCNLRCPFCYNAELVLPELSEALPHLDLGEVLHALQERRGFVDGLVVTGGEPTLHDDLPEFLAKVRAIGLSIKLDTNGTRPEVLGSLLGEGLVDYVALDMKAPFPRYPEFTGIESEKAASAVRRSLGILKGGDVGYELRTTVAPGLSAQDLEEIAREISWAKRYVLQPFISPQGKRLVDEAWRGRPALTVEELQTLVPELQKLVPTELRG